MRAWLVPVLLAVAQAGWLGRQSFRQRWAMFEFDDDLANYDQVVWNTTQGRWFASTTIEHADNWFGDHFAPVVALFVPLYMIWPTPSWMLAAQALALAGGGLVLFPLARARLGLAAAWLVSIAYAAYPGLHHVALFQFHEIALIVPPLMLGLVAIESGRGRLFLAAAVATLTVKEEAAIVVGCLGLLWLLRRRDPRMALTTVALASVWALAVNVVAAVNSGGTGYLYAQRYAHLGRTPSELLTTLVTRPDIVVQTLATLERGRFVAALIGPLLLLPVVGWELILAALPIAGYVLLSASPDMWSFTRHYQTPLVPFLFVGLVVGLARLGRLALPAAGAVAVACVAALALIGPRPNVEVTAHTRDLQQMIGQVPPGASVSASRNVLSSFTRREHVYRFPKLGNADYVLWDFRELRHPAAFGLDGRALEQLVESPDYRMVDSGPGVVLFRRGDARAWPDAPVASFGDQIELLQAQARPGELRTTWRALARQRTQYTIFVHGFDAAGTRIGQVDAPPLDGLMPTDTWAAGHVVVVVRRLPWPAAKVQIGLYDPATGRRLPPDVWEISL